MEKIISVKNVTKTYSSFKLENVSFEIDKGKIVGFVGRNGAGKSTTLKAMMNMIKIDSGTISYLGLDFFKNEQKLKELIGFCEGEINYYKHKKIKDIVRIVSKFYSSWSFEKYKYYLELFNIAENKKPKELSSGMKVKLNLLLSLSFDAKILILDEPTSSLDPFSRDEIINIFKKLSQRGITILFSTHIISDIEKCCDDIIYIRKGKIIENTGVKNFRKKYNEESIEKIILEKEKNDEKITL